MAIRVIFTLLVCLMALACAIMTAIIINYYLSHRPMLFPPLSSMIFILFMGIFTSILYFGYYLFLPSLSSIRRGGLIALMFTMKIEIWFQFAMSSIWISGALAYAADYRGHENCIWDGYYHWPKPSDWGHLCDMVNWVVGMAYATFGIQVAFFAFDLFMSMYMFMFVDQDSMSEPFYEWGTRAWEYKHGTKTPIASMSKPMQYRAKSATPDTYRESHLYDPHSEKRSYESHSDSSRTLSQSRQSRRGTAYSDPSYTDSFSSEDSNTLDGSSQYYGGAYARHTNNSRRAGLREAPTPAGSGVTSSGAPSWTAPTITTEGGSIRRAPSSLRNAPHKVRAASTPTSLGARGRRGASYAGSEAGLQTITDIEEEGTAEESLAVRQNTSQNRQTGGTRARRRLSLDEESVWHLREE